MKKANDGSRVKFYIDKTGFFAESAIYFLIMAAIFRVIGCWGLWTDNTYLLMQIVLPVGCCLLLALCIVLFGKRGFFLSCIPVLLGVVFFIFKSLSFDSWLHTVLCILLYMVVAVLYTATVFGWIRTKWLLPPLFGIPFAVHVFMDMRAMANTAEPVTFAAGMQEMSVLAIMAALFCIGIGLKKRPVEPSVVEAEPVEPVVEPIPETEPIPEAEPAPVEEPLPAVEPLPEAEIPESNGELPPVDEAYFEPSGEIPTLTLEPVIDETPAQEEEHEQ